MAAVLLAKATDNWRPLPALCVGCGRPATGTRRVRILGPSSGYALLGGEHALDNLERMARSPGQLRLPVCWWHRWIIPPATTATAVTGGKIALVNVSAQFAAALHERGRTRPT